MDYGACLKEFLDYSITKDGRVISWKYKKTKELKLKTDRKGYHYVSLCHNNIVKEMRVHRLIAMCYIANPNNLSMVDHIDGNRINNDISNLRWVNHKTNSDNRVPKGSIYYHKTCNRWYVIWFTEPKQRISISFKSEDEAIAGLEQLKIEYPRYYGMY